MPRTGCVHTSNQVNPVLMLIALLGILTMPVDYRAGAAMSHPHATLQLLGDLARGSLAHHGDPVDGLGHVHGASHHQHRVSANHVPPAPPLDLNFPSAWETARVLNSVTAKLTPEVSDLTAAPDEPTVSPRTGGTYIAYKILLPVTAMILILWLVRRLVWTRDSPWRGVNDRPELPPPRRFERLEARQASIAWTSNPRSA